MEREREKQREREKERERSFIPPPAAARSLGNDTTALSLGSPVS